MNRTEFHKLFKSPGPVILPVIHVQTNEQTEHNIRIALSEGAQGVFLINHDFPYAEMLPIIRHARATFPTLWLGVNFLAVTGKDAFPILGKLEREGVHVDAYWADNARIDEDASVGLQLDAQQIERARTASNWDGLYFGGTAFKKQREVPEDKYDVAARIASKYMDVVTTSGIATGHSADLGKIDAIRQGCGDTALALASGITQSNAATYATAVDCYMVATGVNQVGDFYNLDPVKLRKLVSTVRRAALNPPTDTAKNASTERWYLPLLAPNTKGNKFAWLDPSSLYINEQSFRALVDDLAEPFDAGEIDVVAGIDAMGFVLGSALATRLGKGFLAARKAGKIPLDADAVEFTNYSGKTQHMEMRLPAFAPGTRVLLVDQWVETGGTMNAAIDLVRRQQGVVAGIATVCIETNTATEELRRLYKCSSAVLPGTRVQVQCDRQSLDSFDSYRPEMVFPSSKPAH